MSQEEIEAGKQFVLQQVDFWANKWRIKIEDIESGPHADVMKTGKYSVALTIDGKRWIVQFLEKDLEDYASVGSKLTQEVRNALVKHLP